MNMPCLLLWNSFDAVISFDAQCRNWARLETLSRDIFPLPFTRFRSSDTLDHLCVRVFVECLCVPLNRPSILPDARCSATSVYLS